METFSCFWWPAATAASHCPAFHPGPTNHLPHWYSLPFSVMQQSRNENLLSSSWGKPIKLPLIEFVLSWQILRTSKPEREARCPSARARAWCCCVDHRHILEVKRFPSWRQFARFSFSGCVLGSLEWHTLKEKAVVVPAWLNGLRSGCSCCLKTLGDLQLGVSAEKEPHFAAYECALKRWTAAN